MGTGKQLVISGTGYPGTNETWRFIQQAFTEPFEGIARLLGDKVILSGLQPVPNTASYTAGYISYNGEILQFESGAYNAQVTVVETVVSAEYDKDTNNDGANDVEPVMKTRYMRFGTGGVATFPFSDLYRLDTIKALSQFELPNGVVVDPNYIAFTQAMIDKLNSIEESADVNIKPNWNAPEDAANEILNKPEFLLRALRAPGRLYIGDVGGTGEYTVTFAAVATAAYIPVITLEAGSAATAGATHNLAYTTHSYTTTSFKIRIYEISNTTQNLYINYLLIPRVL